MGSSIFNAVRGNSGRLSLAAGLLLGAAGMGRASVLAISASDVPISDPTSIFDANTHSTNSYSLLSGRNFISAGFDVHDLFGGSTGTFGPEQHDVIFDNNQAIGTIESVNVLFNSPASLAGYNFYLEDDGLSGDRSAREFKLYADGSLISDVNILDSTGSQSYTSVYGSNYIQISDIFSNLPLATDYRLELIQNREGNGSSGIRALDFTAIAAPNSAVPEPSTLAGLGIASAGLLGRRRVKRSV